MGKPGAVHLAAEVDELPDHQAAISHHPFLPYSHRCWKKGKSLESIELQRHGIARFPHAIGLNQQLALCLASSSSEAHQAEAESEVCSVARLAAVYRELETLCRLGHVYKDRGDMEYDAEPDGEFTYQRMLKKHLPAY